MKPNKYGVGKSLSVLKLYFICFQQKPVLNVMDIDKVRNLHSCKYSVFNTVIHRAKTVCTNTLHKEEVHVRGA